MEDTPRPSKKNPFSLLKKATDYRNDAEVKEKIVSRFKDGLEGIMEGASYFLDSFSIKDDSNNADKMYERSQAIAKTFKYALSDIEKAAPMMLELRSRKKSEYLGIYLSALVNKEIGDSDIVTLDTKKFIEHNEIWNLGYRHEGGILIIDGTAGIGLGRNMMAGKIIQKNGVCGPMAGDRMEGGELIIEGDLKPGYLGHAMRGGVIEVNGHVETFLKEPDVFYGGEIKHRSQTKYKR